MLVIGCELCPSKKVIHAALAKAAEGRGLRRRGERAHRESGSCQRSSGSGRGRRNQLGYELGFVLFHSAFGDTCIFLSEGRLKMM